MKLAYIVSRFPKLSETFVISEMIEQIALGADIEIYPLQRHWEKVVHGDVMQIMPRVHFFSLFSLKVLKANLHCLAQQPRRYCRVWWEGLSGTLSAHVPSRVLSSFSEIGADCRTGQGVGNRPSSCAFRNPSCAGRTDHSLFDRDPFQLHGTWE